MKQVLQDRNGLTVVRDVPPPPCLPGSILVKNCVFGHQLWNGALAGRTGPESPSWGKLENALTSSGKS